MIDLLTNKQQLFDLWAPLYDFLFPSLFYQASHQRMLEYVELPQHPNVLDLGCVTGRLLQRLANHYPDLRGTGLDFSPEMLHQAHHYNRHRPRLIFVRGNAAPLCFANEQFDSVFNTFSFLHYLEPERVLAEINRVLRPGGIFYLVDPTTDALTGMGFVPVTPAGIRLYSPPMREQMGKQVGFRCLKHHYLLGSNLLTIFIKVS